MTEQEFYAEVEQELSNLFGTEMTQTDYMEFQGDGCDVQLVPRQEYDNWKREGNADPSDNDLDEWWESEKHLSVDGKEFAIISQL